MLSGIDHFMFEYERVCDVLKHRWLDGILQHRNQINKVYNLLSDEESKDTYISEILYCELTNYLKGDLPSILAGFMSNGEWNRYKIEALQLPVFNEIKSPDGSNITDYCVAATYILKQYQYNNIVKIDPGDVCLDIGACFGDTTLWFLKNGAAKSYAFEIDKRNIACMEDNFKGYKDQAHIEKMAISDKKNIVYYLPDKGNLGAGKIFADPPARVNPDDFYKVPTITIDEFCETREVAPSFIKMDIEGAEPIAIKGGVKIFKKYRPKFAICIYHTWPQRWEIPLLLHDILPDYNFYVKKSHPAYETVFFGIPKEALGKTVS